MTFGLTLMANNDLYHNLIVAKNAFIKANLKLFGRAIFDVVKAK